jgi:hypothetical protein
VQRCGDNYLATLRAVAAAAELDPNHPHLGYTESGVWTVEGESDAAVFFDVLGFFMVSYSAGMAMMMHMAAAAVLSFGTEPKHEDDGAWAGACCGPTCASAREGGCACVCERESQREGVGLG